MWKMNENAAKMKMKTMTRPAAAGLQTAKGLSHGFA
jgi:hypothetical protein